MSSALCREGSIRKRQHANAVTSAMALQQQFLVYVDMLERVEVFKYLGRLLALDDNNAQAAQANLRQARHC